jgi:hypothetical protein
MIRQHGMTRSRVVITAQLLGLLAAVAVATVLAGGPGLIGGLGAVVVLVLIPARKDAVSPGNEPAARTPRLGWPVLFSVLILATVSFDVLHLMVWNPLAKVPGHGLDQIYAGLTAANEAQFVPPLLVGWVVFWSLPALILPVLCRAARLTLRHTVLFGLLMIGGVILTGWYFAFGMGMSLADTFETDGGDAPIPSSAVLQVVGQLAIAAAVIIALAPTRTAWRLSVATARLGS